MPLQLRTPTTIYPWPLPYPVAIEGQQCYPGMRAEAIPPGCVIEEAPAPPAETLPAAQDRRTEELAAECDARLEARWPITDRLAALAGVPQTPPAGLAEDVASHLAARDAALSAVAAAGSVEAVNGVQATWPA